MLPLTVCASDKQCASGKLKANIKSEYNNNNKSGVDSKCSWCSGGLVGSGPTSDVLVS